MTTNKIQYGQRRASGHIHIFDVPPGTRRSICGKVLEENIQLYGNFAPTAEELRRITKRLQACMCMLCESILSMRQSYKKGE